MGSPDLTADDALRRLFRNVSGVTSAYVFGSEAVGRRHRESDIDLGVLLQWRGYLSRRDRFEARVRLSGQISSVLHRNDVDLIVLNDAPPHLAREIVTRGRRVCCTDEGADHAFRRTAMLRAVDLEPFLRRTRRIKLDALVR